MTQQVENTRPHQDQDGGREQVMEWLGHQIAESEHMDEDKSDHRCKVNGEINFADNGSINVGAEFGGTTIWFPSSPTDHAWRQIYAKLGPCVYGSGSHRSLPSDYLGAIPSDVRAYCLNDHIRNHDGSWLVRTYKSQCRAVLGPNYPIIWNTRLLQATKQVLEASNLPYPNMRVARSFLTADDLAIRLIWRDTDQDEGPDGGTRRPNYGVGVYIGHNETGRGAIRIYPLVQRTSCENSIVFTPRGGRMDSEEDEGSEIFKGLRLVHQGSAAALRILLQGAIAQALEASGDLLDKILLANDKDLPDIDAVLRGMSKKYHWSDDTRMDVARGTENLETVLGVINGVTFAARHMPTEDEMLQMESLGGELVTLPERWFRQMEEVGVRERRREREPHQDRF